MFKLFHSIFGGGEPSPYPEELIEAAIERSVDATDPWLRGLNGYRRKLRPAVLHAIDHVVGMVQGMDPPLELSRRAYGEDPLLRLFFISSAQLAGVLAGDRELNTFRREAGDQPLESWALLTMACEQRQAFGAELLGETVVRDVPQITVSMSGHRLFDPAADLVATRRQLMRRAFDHLLSLALARITAGEEVREDLLQRRTLLQAKLNILECGGWGFASNGHNGSPPCAELQAQVDDLNQQLRDFGGDDRYIEKHLELVIDALTGAEQQLWVEPLALIVDRMGIKRAVPADDAPELHLKVLRNAAGRQLVARLVRIPLPAA